MAISIIEIDGNEYQLGASASNVAFNNTGTGIQAGTVQRAIQEVKLTPGSGISIDNGVISATGGGGGPQDVSGKADLLANSGMLAPTQWPKVVLRNVADTMLDDLRAGDVYYDSGYLFLQTDGDPVSLGHPNPKTIYFCLADGALYRWHGSGWTLIGGGGDYSLSNVITNINTLQAKIDEVIGKLANSSFSVSPKPTVIGEFDWEITPVETYYSVIGINASSAMYSVSNNATTVFAGSSYTNIITAKTGYNLVSVLVNGVAQSISNDLCVINISNVQSNIVIAVAAEAESAEPGTTYYNISIATSMKYTMSNTATTIEAGQTYTNVIEANAGYDLTSVLVNGVAQTIANNKCTINIVNVSEDITVTVTAEQQSVAPSTTYSVGVTATDLDVEPNGGTVVEGATFQCSIALASGVTDKRLPRLDEITISGTHGTATLSNGVLTIPNIQSNITITASAIAAHNVTYNLTGCTKTSGDTSVSGSLTAVLSKDTANWNSSENFLARDIIVLMGGQVLERGSNLTVTQTSSNADITISIQNVTADVEIMNVVWKNGYTKYTSPSITSSDRSKYNDTIIPIPDGCTEIRIYSNYPGDSYERGIRFYNSSGSDTGGYQINANGNGGTYPGEMIATWDASTALNHKFVRFSCYVFSTYVFNDCWIKYKNGNNELKYIWKGDNAQ